MIYNASKSEWTESGCVSYGMNSHLTSLTVFTQPQHHKSLLTSSSDTLNNVVDLATEHYLAYLGHIKIYMLNMMMMPQPHYPMNYYNTYKSYTGRHLPYGITVLPATVNAPRPNPSRHAGARLTYPEGTVGWVGLGGLVKYEDGISVNGN